MIAINPLLALVALIPAPFVIFAATRYSRVSRPAQQEVQQRIAELTAEAEENVSGIRIVKAFAREEHQLHRFQRAVARVFDQSIYTTRVQAFFSPLIGLLPQIGIALVLLVGGREVIDGSLSLGAFVAFYTYVAMLAGPMRSLGMALGMAQRAVACGNRMFEILDREPAIQSPPGAPAAAARATARSSCAASPCATTAPPRPSATSTSTSRPARRSRWSAPRASGKTSLVGARRPPLRPQRGVGAGRRRRRARGRRRARCARRSPSSPTTASSSPPRSPRTSPTPTRTPRCEQIEAAARRAQADAFIRELPDGYETRVGERGLTLSGGQRQRVAIARALLADPRILILDDATSSVDATTEAAIKAGLQEAMAGRTTFIIAHRLSTVSLADEIVVIDGGTIVDRGSHEELMAGCGFYREIAEHGLADSVFLQHDLEEREEVARL